MNAQTLTAEVNALAIALAEFAFQSIAVRAFEREAILPKRGLRGADVVTAFIARHMITRLRHEPRRAPADVAS